MRDYDKILSTEISMTLKGLIDININALIGIERLGKDGAFQNLCDGYEIARQYFLYMHNTDFTKIPVSILKEIKGSISFFPKFVTELQNTDINLLTNANFRNDLLSRFDNNFHTLIRNTIHILSYANQISDNRVDIKSQINELISEANSEVDKIAKQSKNATKYLADMQEAAGKIAVSNYAKFFGDEAAINLDSSNKWLRGILVSSVLTIAFVILSFFFFPIPDDATIAKIVHYTSTKLIVLSILYFLIVWCAKNFNSQRHNYIINRHRENALTTFKAFVDAAEEDINVKNAVLLQATWSIFSVQNTGYSKDGSETESPNKLIEICTNLGQSVGTPKLNV